MVFKIAWPYFSAYCHLFSHLSVSISLSPFLSPSNGIALFTQQHAICSKARWSDLGGMLWGLYNMNISLHGLYVWKRKSQNIYRHVLCAYVWVGKEAQQTQVIASYTTNDMLYPTVGIHSLGLVVDFSPEVVSLFAQSSFHTASWYMGHAWVPWQQLCLHPD